MRKNAAGKKVVVQETVAGNKSSVALADSLRSLFKQFLLSKKASKKSDATIHFYKVNVEKFLGWCETECEPHLYSYSELGPEHIEEFHLYLQRPQRYNSTHRTANLPLGPYGMHAIARAVRAYVRWCDKRRRTYKGIYDLVEMPTLPKGRPVDVLTSDDICILLEAVGKLRSKFIAYRTRAMILMMVGSGVRAGELLRMSIDQYDVGTHAMTVVGKGRERIVPLGYFVQQDMATWLDHRAAVNPKDNALWVHWDGSPCTYGSLRGILRRLKTSTGIDLLHAHTLRHTFATMAYADGNGLDLVRLQCALGHASIKTTEMYYIGHSRQAILDAAADHSPVDGMFARDERRMMGSLPQDDPSRKAVGPAERADAAFQAQHPPKGRGRPSAKLPPIEQMQWDLESLGSYRVLARKYGVSDRTIRDRMAGAK
jgi:site-specific recombinase XerD